MAEESEGFIRKLLNTFDVNKIPELTLDALLMKLGYDVFEGNLGSFMVAEEGLTDQQKIDVKIKKTKTLVGLAYGPTALRLSIGGSEAGAIVGLAMLAGLGISAVALGSPFNPSNVPEEYRTVNERATYLYQEVELSLEDKLKLMSLMMAVINAARYGLEAVEAAEDALLEYVILLEAKYGVVN